MALADNYRILEYVSDGKQVEFPVLWRFFDPDTVLVKIYSKDGILINHLSYGRDYSVVATGEDTGRVTLTSPVDSGLIVVIYRLEPYVQLLELLNSGKFDLVKLEETLDHIVMLCQQNRDEILRCLKVPPGSDMTGDEFIDDLLNKYNEIIFIFETIKKLLQNLVCQTIEPFTTKAGIRKYYIGEGLPLDPKLYNLLLVLGGVVQEPKRAYTIVDENHIEFTENPPADLRGWGISAISTSTPDLRQMVQDALEKLTYASKMQHGIMRVGSGLDVTSGLVSVTKATKSSIGGIIVGYGLTVDSSGRTNVNFDDMPPDQFEDILKQLRVPIWLEKNATVYVRKTGSDSNPGTLDAPFLTLNKALQHVCDNYNMSKFLFTVDCGEGEFDEDVILPSYSATTGSVQIKGVATKTIIKGSVYASIATGTWHLDGLYLSYNGRNTPGSSYYGAINIAAQALVNVKNTKIFIPDTDAEKVKYGIICNTGTVITRENNSFEGTMHAALYANKGAIRIFKDIEVENMSCKTAFAVASSLGTIESTPSANGGVNPVIIGTSTGRRYAISMNSIINVKGSPEYFPGNANGAVTSGGQYV